MRPAALGATVGSALLGLAAQPAFASTAHRRAHQHFGHNHTHHDHGDDENLELLKPRGRLVNRSGQCAFPEGEAGLVTITPSSMNKGWAMSPDQECTAGSYCPFACEPGMVMNQWKKGTTYQYPESMDGGLYCDEDGAVNKPFPDQPYCVEGVGTVNAVNNCGDVVAFCQTVLPGNEAMLIPTSVSDSVVISVPGPSYWDSTASHFYINPPGYSTEEACAWGTGLEAIGNWSPYVAGANQDSTGNTYVKIGYNPIYTSSYYGVKPSFGLKIEFVSSAESSTGAGGADFCVVTVPEGASANIVVFSTGESTEILGGIFHESAVSSATGTFDDYSASATTSVNVADATTVAVPAAATTSSKSDAVNPDQGRAAFAGLVIAFVAAAVLY
ncbi:putative secreted beta-glucosidase adg3 [Cytospora mali]|uniref:Secreted beta-glucosidase adg3 n=1 Tax=Cytospora mali TaxID=578113 RepID=A0A194UTA0_CYTMA|nr:putative secreted beta-glucosidase adg3 [Valsa mali var. pyri (nom. inval.)]